MIEQKFIVNLKGKDYPIWAGVLDAATRAGLRSLKTRVLQVPSPENGHLAVVEATALFEDGREFTDIGDCSPASTSPHLASAALRLASTRAKGRALRDSVNVGQTMFEELPEGGPPDDAAEPTNGHSQPQVPVRGGVAAPVRSNAGAGVSAGRPARAAGSAAERAPAEDAVCEWPACGRHLTQNNRLISQKNAARDLCPEHLTEFRKAKEQTVAS